ncbi:conserved repeat domain-containing protein/gliding motility-associated C-terminal domain-containing protein [Flavobacteriaceae bacterium MAR_2010_188]|nr:conserved repeat domain-containing protein/gliding motility-associated C-terminal domain-containing protein [Flavobacteriaceae bacterium MAR_2010_188]
MDAPICNKSNKFYLFLFALFLGLSIQAQVRTPFSPRFNESVKGDVTIVANNMLSRSATEDYNGSDGNHDFSDNVYVDIDSDPTTFNSSSAMLTNPNPTSECISLYKVFLYWAAADMEKPDGTDNAPDWDFDNVKIMYPGETDYSTIQADEVIYRGRDTHESNDPYVCFKDITNTVVELPEFYGKYQIANVEAKEGNLSEHGGGNSGTSGGWQIVFIYLSPELPSKNIGIFDGYAHVTRFINNFDVNFNGFQTIPTGNVNANLVIGALEGDQDLAGDRLQILDPSNNFVDISTSQRAANNFFNSKITRNGNLFLDRSPASLNTLGFDAAVLPLNNPNNSVISNNQSSATIRLTSDQETYGLFLIGLAVEVWEPNLNPLSLGVANGNSPVNPGDTVNYTLEVLNSGNDNAVNLEFSTVLPAQISFKSADNLPNGITYDYNTTSRELRFLVEDGIANVNSEQVDITFELEVNDECYFLEDDCTLSYGIQFEATFNGVENPNDQITLSSENFNICSPSPLVVDIIQPKVDWETAAGALDREFQCDDLSGIEEAQTLFPVADKCDFELIKTSGNYVEDENCPGAGTYTNSWVFTDACGVTIDAYVQTISILDTTPPTAGTLEDVKVDCRSAIPEPDTNLTTDFDDNCSTPAVEFFSDESDNLSCPETIIRTYRVTDNCGNYTEVIQKIIVDDDVNPTASNPASLTFSNYDEVPSPDPEVVIDEADNCGIPKVEFVSETNTSGEGCAETIIRNYSVTDNCDNSITVEHIIFIGNATTGDVNPLDIENPETITVSCPGDIPAPDVSIVNAGTNSVIFKSESSDGQSCPETITRIYDVRGACGETATVNHVIIVNDEIPPTASNPLSIIVDDPSQVPEPDISVVRDAADNCGVPVVAFVLETDDPVECTNFKTRIYSVTDACGNSINVSQEIIIGFEITIEMTGPADLSLDCEDEIPQPDISLITAIESEGNDVKIEFVSDTSEQDGCDEIISRVYMAYNECGAYEEYIQKIVVSDNTAPYLNTEFQKEIAVMCQEAPSKPDLEFLDNCSEEVTISYNEETNVIDEKNKDLIRTWTASDSCGNTTEETQIIHIESSPNYTEKNVSVCIGEDAINLNDFSEGINGSWDGDYAELLSDKAVFDPTYVAVGDYTFTFRSSAKVCPTTFKLLINVNDNCVDIPCIKSIADIEISKLVTPNSDGFNDTFEVGYVLDNESQVKKTCEIDIHLQVFNRWGAKVFEADNYNNDWDGSSNSISQNSSGKLPAGAYYYIVELRNSGLDPVQGYIHLGVTNN